METHHSEATLHRRPEGRIAQLIAGRRWLAVLAATLLLQSGLVVSLNYLVDPRAEFGTGVFEPLVVDSRRLKIMAYAGLDPKPETLVAGSSRATTISPAVLEEAGYGRTYNFAVESGKITDALRVYEEAAAAGAAPARMIVLAEDWAFRSTFHVDWPAEEGIRAGDVAERAARLAATARLDYVSDSVRSLQLHAEGFPLRDMAIQPDGTTVWERIEHEQAHGVFDPQAAIATVMSYATPMYQRVDGAPLAPEEAYVRAFRELLEATRASGTMLTLVVPPVTPEAAARFDAAAYAEAQASMRALLETACGPGVRLVDLSDPASYGATAADFNDGFHPTRAGGERLTRAILQAPDLCQQAL